MKVAIRILLLLAVGFGAASSSLLASSTTTGVLRGHVADVTGAPIAGATVELAGDPIGAARNVFTDREGHFRFFFVPPGEEYRLSARAEGFEQIVYERIAVRLGAEATLDIQLRPSFSEQISAVAATPLINTTSPTVSTNITADQLTTLPARRDFQQLTTIAPGVVIDTRSSDSPTVSGATHMENDYIVEGLSTRDPRFGTSAANLPPTFIEQVQVITTAAPTEYGRALGGVFNVITRSGTNTWSGDVVGRFESADWSPERVERVFRESETFYVGNDKQDAALSLGGPIVRDRMWFFIGANPRRDSTPRRLVDAALMIDRVERVITNEEVYSGKISYSVTPSHLLTLTAFGNPKEQSGWFSGPRSVPEAALATQTSGSRNVSLRYSGSIGAAQWVEVLAGRHHQDLSYRASTETGRTTPWQFDVPRQFVYGGLQNAGEDDADRELFSLRSGRSLGRHELSGGAELELNRFDSAYVDSWFVFMGSMKVNDTIGTRDVLREFRYDTRGYGDNDATAAYIEDRIGIGNNLIATVGLRWEQQVIGSGSGVTIVEGVADNGAMIGRPADNFTFENNLAPRLGLVWDPTGSARGKIYVAAGRYFEAIPTALNVSFLNGISFDMSAYYRETPYPTGVWYNPSGSPLDDGWVRYAHHPARYPPRAGGIDPSTKLQYQDEVSVGTEWLIGSNATIGLRYVDRRLGRTIDDRGTWNPQDPRKSSGEYFLINPGEGEYGSAFDRPERNYQAIHATFDRRLTARWQLNASFVAARERGDYDGLYEYSSSAAGPNNGFAFDVPGLQRNSYGRLRGDRPYQLKLHSSVDLPFGITLAENFIYSAGTPVSALVAPRFSGGKRVLHLVPRGSMGRTPDVWSLDVRAEWRTSLPMLRQRGFALFVDLFNATDNHGALEVDENYIYPGMPGIGQWTTPANLDEWGFPRYDASLPRSPYFKTPTLYQSPRAIQIGVKLQY